MVQFTTSASIALLALFVASSAALPTPSQDNIDTREHSGRPMQRIIGQPLRDGVQQHSEMEPRKHHHANAAKNHASNGRKHHGQAPNAANKKTGGHRQKIFETDIDDVETFEARSLPKQMGKLLADGASRSVILAPAKKNAKDHVNQELERNKTPQKLLAPIPPKGGPSDDKKSAALKQVHDNNKQIKESTLDWRQKMRKVTVMAQAVKAFQNERGGAPPNHRREYMDSDMYERDIDEDLEARDSDEELDARNFDEDLEARGYWDSELDELD
ncbi:hypothetical protein AMATHDRAFT_47965 [Amanita thiersii Skay4041]|uniref:Uncharacterized protein n=1 Tax=Amanita thiersii Skay4041 TaxID=703135 RepID=A0A2A9NRK0_9AGAR|nr:hypothetical protein AMATHDRAFT_47965 [Amanita thiersii Skay4041]